MIAARSAEQKKATTLRASAPGTVSDALGDHIVFLGGGVHTYVLAFVFALLAVVLSYFAGRVSKVTTSVTLILGGVIVSSFFSALIRWMAR